ncbi:hypothetical protein SAMN05421810_106251 [Amycolatopsis arida]|uniref:Secreted protein n=1 Tax=Amycolatopsis arida TaxID=587909 RepID=A0A1I5XTU6_9PSEU|nr:hypothetical protein CLV69_102371 [Amycolatopsis arida]SFQ35393.1 hypothetical protein SAMN05421810_106251 [Amycolatopsis arida]
MFFQVSLAYRQIALPSLASALASTNAATCLACACWARAASACAARWVGSASAGSVPGFGGAGSGSRIWVAVSVSPPSAAIRRALAIRVCAVCRSSAYFSKDWPARSASSARWSARLPPELIFARNASAAGPVQSASVLVRAWWIWVVQS